MTDNLRVIKAQRGRKDLLCRPRLTAIQLRVGDRVRNRVPRLRDSVRQRTLVPKQIQTRDPQFGVKCGQHFGIALSVLKQLRDNTEDSTIDALNDELPDRVGLQLSVLQPSIYADHSLMKEHVIQVLL